MSKMIIQSMRLKCCICLIALCYITEAQITFEKTYGSSAFEEAKSIRQTSDGGYIIGGTNLVKIDSLGNTEWTQAYPSFFANPTSDQGHILVDYNNVYASFNKVASNGDILWQNTYDEGIWANEGNYIEQVQDGGYIVAGRFQHVVGSGMLLLKLDETGNKEWRKVFSEPTSAAFSYGFSTQQTNDSGYFTTGYTYINYYDSTRHKDVFVLKTDDLGNEEWRKYFGGTGDDTGSFGMQNNEGNYYITGTSNSYSNGIESDIYLIKLNAAGDSLWTRTFGGVLEESSNGLWPTDDGGCILVGHSNSFTNGDDDGYVIKIDTDGNTLWTKNYGASGDESIHSVQQTLDGGYIMAGYTNSIGAGDFDMFVLKTDSLGNSNNTTSLNENLTSNLECTIYPNPSNGVFSIKSNLNISKIKIYTILGETVYSKNINGKQAAFNLIHNPNGIYFYTIFSQKDKIIKSGKIILE